MQIERHLKDIKKHGSRLGNLKRKLTNEFMSGKLRIPPEALKNVQ